MGGVGVADQQLGAHAHVHKPITYFWRRVFDQKFSQAISNAYLLFVEWAEMLLRQCTAALESATEDGAQEGERGAVVNDCVFTAPELKEFEALLKKALKIERVQWDERLANHFMPLCAVGHIDKGQGAPQRLFTRTWSMAHVPPRYAMGGHAQRKPPALADTQGLERAECAGAMFARSSRGKLRRCTFVAAARKSTRRMWKPLGWPPPRRNTLPSLGRKCRPRD